MKKYRVKEIGDKFYPQIKDGIKTLWMWSNFSRNDYSTVVYDNLDDATDYCKKNKKATDTIIWKLSENDLDEK